jgi:hypothetical protein
VACRPLVKASVRACRERTRGVLRFYELCSPPALCLCGRVREGVPWDGPDKPLDRDVLYVSDAAISAIFLALLKAASCSHA